MHEMAEMEDEVMAVVGGRIVVVLRRLLVRGGGWLLWFVKGRLFLLLFLIKMVVREMYWRREFDLKSIILCLLDGEMLQGNHRYHASVWVYSLWSTALNTPALVCFFFLPTISQRLIFMCCLWCPDLACFYMFPNAYRYWAIRKHCPIPVCVWVRD